MSKKTKNEKMQVHYSSEVHDWETDRKFFDVVNREFKFGLDAAATAENTLCKRFLTVEDDALSSSWAKHSKGAPVWVNPPYGRGLFKWMCKAADEGSRVTVAILTPARTDTKFFEVACSEGEVRLLPGRLTFYLNGEPATCVNKEGKEVVTKAPFPSMLTVFGPDIVPGTIHLWYWR